MSAQLQHWPPPSEYVSAEHREALKAGRLEYEARAMLAVRELDEAKAIRDSVKLRLQQLKGEAPDDIQQFRVGGVPLWVWAALAALAWRQKIWQR